VTHADKRRRRKDVDGISRRQKKVSPTTQKAFLARTRVVQRTRVFYLPISIEYSSPKLASKRSTNLISKYEWIKKEFNLSLLLNVVDGHVYRQAWPCSSCYRSKTAFSVAILPTDLDEIWQRYIVSLNTLEVQFHPDWCVHGGSRPNDNDLVFVIRSTYLKYVPEHNSSYIVSKFYWVLVALRLDCHINSLETIQQ